MILIKQTVTEKPPGLKNEVEVVLSTTWGWCQSAAPLIPMLNPYLFIFSLGYNPMDGMSALRLFIMCVSVDIGSCSC